MGDAGTRMPCRLRPDAYRPGSAARTRDQRHERAEPGSESRRGFQQLIGDPRCHTGVSASSRRRYTPTVLVVLVASAALNGCAGSTTDRDSAADAPHSLAAGRSTSASSAPTTMAVSSAVFASPTGAFLCSLDHGVVDCMWPASTHGIPVPAAVCSPMANEGPELRPGHAPGWLCGTDVGVVATLNTISWAPAGTPTAPAHGGLPSPELADGVTLTSRPTH